MCKSVKESESSSSQFELDHNTFDFLRDKSFIIYERRDIYK